MRGTPPGWGGKQRQFGDAEAPLIRLATPRNLRGVVASKHTPRSRERAPMTDSELEAVSRRVAELIRGELTPPEWLTPDQAAAYCGLTTRGLEDMRTRKTGPVAHKVSGRIVRYRRADLDAWMESGREAR
jgi:predicted DNA-binding transcriptional regulator AlpA